MIPLGLVVESSDDHNTYVYVGSRITKIKTIEHVFCRVLNTYWPHCLRTYHASRPETLKRKFPLLEDYL